MLHPLTDSEDGAPIPLIPIRADALSAWLETQAGLVQTWLTQTGFKAKPGTVALIPDAAGALAGVLIGIGRDDGENGGIWTWAALPERLPDGTYRLDDTATPVDAGSVALGWALGAYGFDRYKKIDKSPAVLVWPAGCDRAHVTRTAEAVFLVRDLINTPASDNGPEELAAAGTELFKKHRGRSKVIVGADLLAENFPAIHAVGRASDRAPRLFDGVWGDETAPKITLVGKGVCFDTGGLDLKSAAGMKLMKKDMGGGAHAFGLASMIMDAGLPVRLRVLVPAVENSVAGNAMRPMDIVQTRKGLSVEIGNTDAEGRVILADALAEAAAETPDVLIDFATLTGAARVALGTDLPALFCNDDGLAAGLLDHGVRLNDPLWRLPLWAPYRKMIEGKIADINNAPEGGYAGAITAALFLEAFVEKDIPWAHIDLMAWNVKSRPGRPEGGEAMGIRALYGYLAERFDPAGR
ncbi:MAG: leucyl aminopeptidase family protein [Rhodospirillales bacterium]